VAAAVVVVARQPLLLPIPPPLLLGPPLLRQLVHLEVHRPVLRTTLSVVARAGKVPRRVSHHTRVRPRVLTTRSACKYQVTWIDDDRVEMKMVRCRGEGRRDSLSVIWECLLGTVYICT
jgi:hypothetical protein